MNTTISAKIQEQYACRPMTLNELVRLGIENCKDFEYYVCDNWVKFILNYISLAELESELKFKIDINFETEIAKKQQQSVQKHLKTKRIENQDYGQRPDIRATLGTGMQQARYIRFQRQEVLKKVIARNINPFCAWHYRDKAKEKVYALLSTQEPNTKVYINFIALSARSTITKRNIAVWFSNLSFDMFKIKKENFYPVVSHNLALASIGFSNEKLAGNAYIVFNFKGVESLHQIVDRQYY